MQDLRYVVGAGIGLDHLGEIPHLEREFVDSKNGGLLDIFDSGQKIGDGIQRGIDGEIDFHESPWIKANCVLQFPLDLVRGPQNTLLPFQEGVPLRPALGEAFHRMFVSAEFELAPQPLEFPGELNKLLLCHKSIVVDVQGESKKRGREQI